MLDDLINAAELSEYKGNTRKKCQIYKKPVLIRMSAYSQKETLFVIRFSSFVKSKNRNKTIGDAAFTLLSFLRTTKNE